MAPKFRYMESNLYNLVPAAGEIDGLRSNYSFAMILGEKRAFGKYDMEIEGIQGNENPFVKNYSQGSPCSLIYTGEIATTGFFLSV